MAAAAAPFSSLHFFGAHPHCKTQGMGTMRLYTVRNFVIGRVLFISHGRFQNDESGTIQCELEMTLS